MAQYSVPQFIERETRILGPLTMRQVLLFGVVALILFVLYFYINLFVLTIIGAILVGGALVIAFIKVNGRPLSTFLFSFLGYFINPKKYIWGKQKSNTITPRQRLEGTSAEEPKTPVTTVDAEKIKKLAEILNR